jgi:hypothetical protein
MTADPGFTNVPLHSKGNEAHLSFGYDNSSSHVFSLQYFECFTGFGSNYVTDKISDAGNGPLLDNLSLEVGNQLLSRSDIVYMYIVPHNRADASTQTPNLAVQG